MFDLREIFPGQTVKTEVTDGRQRVQRGRGAKVPLLTCSLRAGGAPAAVSAICIQPSSLTNSACGSLLPEMCYFKCFPSAPKGAMCLSCFPVKKENQFHSYLRKVSGWGMWGGFTFIKMEVGGGAGRASDSHPTWPVIDKQ